MKDGLIPDSVVSEVIGMISHETGLRFAGHQLETVRKGIREAMRRSGELDPHRVLQQISSNSPVFDDLVSELTIGETYFFRDPSQFAVIRHQLLPSLVRRKGANHRIRVWSAGCASGEEPYSIAILFHALDMLERCHVLATDISHHALARARAGKYRPWSIRGSQDPLLKNFLIADKGGYVIDEGIRTHVVFEYLNLALDTYPSFATGTWGLDLILCRNVLIYFNRDTIAAVAKRFYQCLSPGGWLMLGASDPRISDFAPFETQMTESGLIYYRPDSTELDAEFRLPRLPVTEPMEPSSELVQHELSRGRSLEPIPHEPLNRTSDATRADMPITKDSGGKPGKTSDRGIGQDAAFVAIEIRELAKLDAEAAEQRCAEAIEQHPISVELRFLHAVLLLELERNVDAVEAARRVVFLDRELAIGHMTLGTVLQRTGQIPAARRAFRNALQLCKERPASEIVPLSDGEQAGRLALSAKQHLALLEGD